MTEHKRWRQLVGPGVLQHQAIIPFTLHRTSRLHDHDFPEVFWLEKGRGRHHINGSILGLSAGDLVFVRPEDQHRLEAIDENGFTLINVAYDPRVRNELLKRHAKEVGPQFSPPTKLPFRAVLGATPLRSLRAELVQLSAASGSRVALEHFLLGLHRLISPPAKSPVPPMPEWLRQASEDVQRPEIFSLGAPGLVKVAGRSAEHVARTVRAVFGRTPSDYVNGVRMEFAARELRVTSRPIADIALDCGLNNLSHFYSLFRSAHGQTPRAYRLAHHRIVA
jgi:AraC family cel operon transcriptional repressor